MPSRRLNFPYPAEDGIDSANRTTLQRVYIEPTRLESQAYASNGSNSSSGANKEHDVSSHDDIDIMMDLVVNLEGVARRMVDEPLDVEMNELRARGLLAQAAISESNYARLGTAECIEKVVECRGQALSLTTEGDAGRSYQLAKFGASLCRKFERLGDINDINKAIQSLSQAMLLTPDRDPNKLALLNNIGIGYQARFERLGELADLDQALECQTQAVQLTPDDDPDKPSRLNNLGNTYMARYGRLGNPADVQRAIECLTQAVQLTPDGHPDKPTWLSSLGHSYQARLEYLGEISDVDKAIELQTQAVQLCPDRHPRKPNMLDNLGSAYTRRFKHCGELSDVQKAIECHTQVVHLTPDGHPHKSGCLNNLATSYMLRFERLGELPDIDKAIEWQTQVVELTPADHPDKPRKLNNLGNAYQGRFERVGELADLDKAIECETQAVQLTLSGHPEKPSRLSNLGISYLGRFERLGELADVDKAIECQTQAVQLTPDGHSDKPSWLNNLGNAYQGRFEHLGGLADLDKAVKYETQAVQLTPDGHPDKPIWLNNLGNAYMRRSERLGDPAEMHKAIECHTQAVQLAPDGHPSKPSWLNNLGNSYGRRFERLGELADADKSIECQTQAVQLTPEGHPQQPTLLNNLGNSYLCRFRCRDDRADLQRAQSTFQKAAQLAISSPEAQLRCARNWAMTSSLLSLSPQEAYERCMELVPHLIWLGTTINHRYSLLANVGDLATEAASWAISAESYDLAIEWLEEGRSIVWNQILHLRTPFDNLATVNPQLAQRLNNLAIQLENASSRQVAQDSWTAIDVDSDLAKAAQNHHRLAAEWEQCLEQARSIPGFDNFMRPRKAVELKAAATDGPVVIINAHSTRWDALIISPHCADIAHLPLAQFSSNRACESGAQLYFELMAEHRGERAGGFERIKQGPKHEDQFKTLLAALWSAIVEPTLNVLGCTRNMSLDELPHVTWCATGVLAFLPLHAAGLYDGSTPTAFDLVISSYTPSLSALLTSNTSSTQPNMGLLAVGQEYTRGLCQLPNTVYELAVIKRQAKAICFLQLDGKNATVNAVLNAMDEHRWVHLACHATQNPVDPAQSAFHLYDGQLTLEAITKRQFRDKGLAFLSACQTAKGDGKLSDEAVHLAAGMLMAGYPSVIATMWSIADVDGPEVAGRVYAELLKDGQLDHRGAAKALHKAIAELREKIGEESFERWVPFIHIGV